MGIGGQADLFSVLRDSVQPTNVLHKVQKGVLANADRLRFIEEFKKLEGALSGVAALAQNADEATKNLLVNNSIVISQAIKLLQGLRESHVVVEYEKAKSSMAGIAASSVANLWGRCWSGTISIGLRQPPVDTQQLLSSIRPYVVERFPNLDPTSEYQTLLLAQQNNVWSYQRLQGLFQRLRPLENPQKAITQHFFDVWLTADTEKTLIGSNPMAYEGLAAVSSFGSIRNRFIAWVTVLGTEGEALHLQPSSLGEGSESADVVSMRDVVATTKKLPLMERLWLLDIAKNGNVVTGAARDRAIACLQEALGQSVSFVPDDPIPPR